MVNRFRYLLVVGVLLQLLSLWFNDGDTSVSLAIAPLAIGALAASGGAALSGLINNQNKQNAEYSLDMQKRLMDYTWSKYNSPKAQAKAYADAGFNPAVAFGQGGMSSPVAPSMSAPELSQIGLSSSMSDLGTLVSTGSQALLAAAEAKKVGLEAEGQKLLNDYNAETLAERVRGVGLQNKWTEEQTTKVIQDWNKTVAEINVLSKDAEIRQIDLDKHKSLVDAIIQHYVSGSNKSDAEADSIREQLPIILKKLQAQADVLSVDADIAKDYKETMTKVGVVGDVIKIIQTLVKVFGK